MRSTSLTFKSIKARSIVLKLKRQIVARIATITDWPGKGHVDDAVSGLDMAAWDALAKAANMPLCVLLGSLQPS